VATPLICAVQTLPRRGVRRDFQAGDGAWIGGDGVLNARSFFSYHLGSHRH
jgi:hypothetical protein